MHFEQGPELLAAEFNFPVPGGAYKLQFTNRAPRKDDLTVLKLKAKGDLNGERGIVKAKGQFSDNANLTGTISIKVKG